MGDKNTFTIMDIMAALPAVKNPPAFVGDLHTFIAATVAQAVLEAAEPPPGAAAQVFICPADHRGNWLHVGSTDFVNCSGLIAMIEGGDERGGIQFKIRHMTEAEIEALPEHMGF